MTADEVYVLIPFGNGASRTGKLRLSWKPISLNPLRKRGVSDFEKDVMKLVKEVLIPFGNGASRTHEALSCDLLPTGLNPLRKRGVSDFGACDERRRSAS